MTVCFAAAHARVATLTHIMPRVLRASANQKPRLSLFAWLTLFGLPGVNGAALAAVVTVIIISWAAIILAGLPTRSRAPSAVEQLAAARAAGERARQERATEATNDADRNAAPNADEQAGEDEADDDPSDADDDADPAEEEEEAGEDEAGAGEAGDAAVDDDEEDADDDSAGIDLSDADMPSTSVLLNAALPPFRPGTCVERQCLFTLPLTVKNTTRVESCLVQWRLRLLCLFVRAVGTPGCPGAAKLSEAWRNEREYLDSHKSQKKGYTLAYRRFMKWCQQKECLPSLKDSENVAQFFRKWSKVRLGIDPRHSVSVTICQLKLRMLYQMTWIDIQP